MKLRVGGAVGATFENLIVRVSAGIKLEVHVDTDEGNACGLREDSICELISGGGCGCDTGNQGRAGN